MPGSLRSSVDSILYGDFLREAHVDTWVTTFASNPDLFDEMKGDPGYDGWGYLRARDHLGRLLQGMIDHAVAEAADDLSMSYRQLFTWANSRSGRLFLDRPSRDWSPKKAKEKALEELRSWLDYLEQHPEEA